MQTTLLKPKAIQVEPLGGHRAKATLEPFERGYGHTLGNALRRVLLSSMVGYAPTEVTIAGVLHEYSAIDGVQEDVVHIMLNLKGVVFRLHNRDEVTLVLRKEGEGAVTAGDIQTPHDVEIINPEHVIAHLSQGGKLDMQIKVEKGRGYVPGNLRRFGDEPTKSIGRIVLDASFSPVRRVLLSSMVGYAPTEVTIAGVLHEYSAIDGVQEDVVHIMLNLKGVVFRLHNRDEVTLVLRKEGEGAVTASGCRRR